MSLLGAKSVPVFAVVDHSGEALKVGLEMRATKLVIFGNPRAGTPLMIATPEVAIDLPLKLLIAETESGETRISYNSVAYLTSRYGLDPELAQNLALIEQLAGVVAG